MKRFITTLLAAMLGQSFLGMAAAEGITRPGLRPMESDPRVLSLYQPFRWDRLGRAPTCEAREHGEVACLRGVAYVDDASVIPHRGHINFARLSKQCMAGPVGDHMGQFVSGPYLLKIDRFGKIEISTWLQGNSYPKVHLDGLCWRR